MLLLVRAKEMNDPLYSAFCEYEQLKYFIRMNLVYGRELFIDPFNTLTNLLKDMRKKMLTPNEVKTVLLGADINDENLTRLPRQNNATRFDEE